MADALLLAGDEDIRVGVQQAQEFGVRVHLIGIAPARENQSGFLVQEADTVQEVTAAEVGTFLKRAPASAAPAGAVSPALAATLTAELGAIADRIAAALSTEEKEAVLAESVGGSVPANVDRRLLGAGSEAAEGALLTPEQKWQLGRRFLDACRGSTRHPS